MGQACDAASPREENEVRAELEGEGEIGAE